MKKLLPLLAISLLFSCGESSGSGSHLDEGVEFSYSLDTVKVDSGDLLLAVDRGISTMALSPDKNSLYFYNSTELRLDQIDLNTYKVTRSIQFTQEGPTGIGGLSPYEFHITENEEVFISSSDGIRKMDREGNRITMFNWENLETDLVPENTILSFSGDFDDSGNRFFGTYGKTRGGNSSGEGIAIVDLKSDQLTTKKIPLLDALAEFEIRLEAEISTINTDRFYLHHRDNQVLISTNGVNGLTIYNYQEDSLTEKIYKTQLLPEKRPGTFARRVNSMEALEEAIKAKYKEPTFGPFIYDNQKSYFYRFSTFSAVSATDGEKLSVVLSIFDHEFNMIYEERNLPEFTGNVFFRNGLLHKAINQNDELFFVRLKPNLKNL